MFNNPFGLWLLTLWVPLTLLFLVSPRPLPKPVSALWLWSTTQLPTPRRLPRRPPLDALPWYVAVALFAIGAAEPAWPRLRTAPSVAIVIDTSASMTTREAQTDRLSLAKARISAWLTRAESGTQVLLVPTHAPQQTTLVFRSDGEALHQALRNVEATALSGRLQDAITVALTRLHDEPPPHELVVVTDGALAQEDPLFVDKTPYQIWYVGVPHANHAITSATVSQAPDAEAGVGKVTVSVGVTNYTDDTFVARVSVQQDNATTTLAKRDVPISAHRTATVTLQFPAVSSDTGTGLVAELETTDRMRIDDKAYLVIPQRATIPVSLPQSAASSWFERALKADPEVAIHYRSQQATSDELLVFVAECPPTTPHSDYVVIAPPAGSCLSVEVSAEVIEPTLTKWREEDARFSYVDPSEVRLTKTRTLTGSTMTSLLEAREGVVMAHLADSGSTGTIIGFDIDDSDWPARPSFVMFIRNVVHHARTRQFQPSDTTGDGVYTVSLPREVRQVRIRSPDGKRVERTVDQSFVSLAAEGQPGFYSLSWQGPVPGSTRVGVSVLNAIESDPTLYTDLEVIASPVTDDLALPIRPTVATWLVALGVVSLALGLARLRPTRLQA